MNEITVVVGGQYGSEAKGTVTGAIAARVRSPQTSVVVRVAGPNAGHTAYDAQGREWKLRSVPVAAVTNPEIQLHIAAGSEIDPTVLANEIIALEEAGIKVQERLTIHPLATILEQRHIDAESGSDLVSRLGSTAKGIGAARADRIMRRAILARDLYPTRALAGFDQRDWGHVIIEGTQGYGLGLHTDAYPQVTSSDCRAIDFMAMAGVSPWVEENTQLNIVVVARCFPIRVAGNSGPLKGETTWAELGLPEERTTVTNNVRRVGEWDYELVLSALLANGGGNWNENVRLAITMLDQKFPEVKGVTDHDDLSQEARTWLLDVSGTMEAEIDYIGTGPTTHVWN